MGLAATSKTWNPHSFLKFTSTYPPRSKTWNHSTYSTQPLRVGFKFRDTYICFLKLTNTYPPISKTWNLQTTTTRSVAKPRPWIHTLCNGVCRVCGWLLPGPKRPRSGSGEAKVAVF